MTATPPPPARLPNNGMVLARLANPKMPMTEDAPESSEASSDFVMFSLNGTPYSLARPCTSLICSAMIPAKSARGKGTRPMLAEARI